MRHNPEPRIGHPPRWAVHLLQGLSRHTDSDSFLNDMEMEFENRAEDQGRRQAALWYGMQSFMAVPELILLTLSWRVSMFNNTVKTTFRNLQKHMTYSVINVAGLAIGMALMGSQLFGPLGFFIGLIMGIVLALLSLFGGLPPAG